ncbi:MAG: PCP reductase family protein [Nitrospinae bacterium]|nr:PCP reductase family protein [Nitrospinota bacterium]
MEVIQSSVARDTENQITWDPGAETRLANVPPFARPMARKAIERFAESKGIRTITAAVMDEARALM